MATQTQYYNLDKPSYDEVADIEIINANMDKIDTQMRNNADGVNFAKGISSDAYDNSKTYSVGDYCIYDNKLYRCITAIESAEAFNVKKWKQTTVGNEVRRLNSNLENKLIGTVKRWLPENGIDIFDDNRIPNGISAYSVYPNMLPGGIQLPDNNKMSYYATLIIVKGVSYPVVMWIDVFGVFGVHGSDKSSTWKILN